MLGFGAISELAISALPTPAPDEDTILGGGGYVHPYVEYQNREYQRKTAEEKRLELQRIDDELAQAEANRAALLAEEKAGLELAALEARLLEEINELRNQRAWLMRLIDDDEAMLVIQLCRPFH